MNDTVPNLPTPRRLAACLVLASLTQPVFAETASEPSRAYTIPAEALSDALTEFADQSNLKLVFNAELARGLKAKALAGKLTVRQGLQKLLEGSGLNYRFVGPTTAIIEKAPKASDVQSARSTVSALSVSASGQVPRLPTVVVTGQTDPRDPYNPDYVLPNATPIPFPSFCPSLFSAT